MPGLRLELELASLPDISVLRPCAPTATIPIIRTLAQRKATMGRSGSSVACSLGPAHGITATIDLVSIDPFLITMDGMVHTLSLILATTMAEPFTPIAAQSPAPRLAADSGAVPARSAVADVANRLEGCLNQNGPSVYRSARLVCELEIPQCGFRRGISR
jgi:hypothetical protein